MGGGLWEGCEVVGSVWRCSRFEECCWVKGDVLGKRVGERCTTVGKEETWGIWTGWLWLATKLCRMFACWAKKFLIMVSHPSKNCALRVPIAAKKCSRSSCKSSFWRANVNAALLFALSSASAWRIRRASKFLSTRVLPDRFRLLLAELVWWAVEWLFMYLKWSTAFHYSCCLTFNCRFLSSTILLFPAAREAEVFLFHCEMIAFAPITICGFSFCYCLTFSCRSLCQVICLSPCFFYGEVYRIARNWSMHK